MNPQPYKGAVCHTAEDCLRAGLLTGMRVTAELRPGRQITGRLTLIVKDGVSIREPHSRTDTPCVMPPWRVWLAPTSPASAPEVTVHGMDPEGICPTFYDGCNCPVEVT